MFYPQTTLNCNGILLDLSVPVVMGILNITPDSFYDGGKYADEKAILVQVEKMLEEGAEIIDIGAMSSRPGAALISESDEKERLLPVIRQVKKQFPNAILSVDTWRSEIAKAVVNEGAGIINDISGGQYDPKLFDSIAALKNIPLILMHIPGKPNEMHKIQHHNDICEDVLKYFIEKAGQLRAMGIKDIVLDPGFGFGKSLEDNYKLLKDMHVFQIMEMPILAGLSRKSMIYKPLGTTPEKALNGTTALHMIALQQGARILRAHDVKAAKEVITLHSLIS
ncbi:MAG: dihydropteroate synthase [Saprospiraceae bacterium]